VDALWVTLAAFVTALATGLGALPFAFVPRMSRAWLGVSNAIAAGFMLSASGALVIEGALRGVGRTAAGAAVGALFIYATHRALGHRELHFAELRGADAMKAVLIVTVMTLHSFSEGVGVGVSYGGGVELGVFITIAIAVHNIPEGLAISLVLVPRGTSPRTAAAWSVFSSLPQPLMAVPAFLFVEEFSAFLPLGLGFAAGAMIWLVAVDLVPEALETSRPLAVAGTVTASAAAMLVFVLLLL
jgi:zinc transporter, ZIP family